jgi:hypothetical protein
MLLKAKIKGRKYKMKRWCIAPGYFLLPWSLSTVSPGIEPEPLPPLGLVHLGTCIEHCGFGRAYQKCTLAEFSSQHKQSDPCLLLKFSFVEFRFKSQSRNLEIYINF